MDIISGDWTKIDKENQITEITFTLKDELIAKMIFDLKNDEILTEGNLSTVTGQEENSDFIKTYEECSKEILRIT